MQLTTDGWYTLLLPQREKSTWNAFRDGAAVYLFELLQTVMHFVSLLYSRFHPF